MASLRALTLPHPRRAARCRFEGFYVYICAALLIKFSPRLKVMPFQDLVQFLQKLPTREWTVKDVEELLSQAFVFKSLFDSSPRHYLS